jgi:hypothetical protein
MERSHPKSANWFTAARSPQFQRPQLIQYKVDSRISEPEDGSSACIVCRSIKSSKLVVFMAKSENL